MMQWKDASNRLPARSTSSERPLLPRRIAANIHLYHSDKVLHPVCLSVCPLLTIYSKSECRRNFIFIGDILQDTSNWDSHRFND